MKSCVRYTFITLGWAYLLLLLSWFSLHLWIGDRLVYLALTNFIAVYFFFPLPLIGLVALACRSRSLWFGIGAAALAFAWIWGIQFLPFRTAGTNGEPTLKVMTYNVLALQYHTGQILETIRLEDPDVVLIQELNLNLAGELSTRFSRQYPYQLLEPESNPTGIGVISKYPLHRNGVETGLRWMGGPLFFEIEWNGKQIPMVNFHMVPTPGLDGPAQMAAIVQLRDAQATWLKGLAGQEPLFIMGGDANSTPLNESYRILASSLQDSWREAGFGLGHTFPGSAIPGSSRPQIFGWYVPRWLARIDYIFHASAWETVESKLARMDGFSDHRGVVSTFRLKK